MQSEISTPLTKNPELLRFVADTAKMTKPDRIVWCDGSEEEKQRLTERGGRSRASSIRSTRRSSPAATSTARTRTTSRASSTSPSSARPTKDEAGPDQQLDGARRGVRQARQALRRLDEGPHDVRRARTSWARSARRSSKVGVELTDSIYVVAQHADHDAHGQGRARHARRLRTTSTAACTRTLDLQPRAPLHLPLPAGQHDLVASARGYGGNVLLGKKCLALRIGSYLGQQRGLARRAHAHPRRREPRGRDDLRRGGVPERLRQDELRDDDPAASASRAGRSGPSATTSPGCASAPDGRLWAINPEAGYFGVAPGTSYKSNPNAMKTIAQGHDLHQRRAHAGRRRVVGRQGRRGRPPSSSTGRAARGSKGSTREGGAPEQPLHRADDEQPGARRKFAERSARRADQRDHLRRPPRDDGAAGACRPSTGRTASSSARRIGSETTAAATGKVGVVRRDPMAMLPFCGYNMGDYFAALAATCSSASTHPPKIFHGELVPQGQGRQVPLAGLRREHARAQVDRRPRARPRRRPGDAVRLGAARPATSISRASTSPHEQVDEATAHRPRRVAQELESPGGVLRAARRQGARGPHAPAQAAPLPPEGARAPHRSAPSRADGSSKRPRGGEPGAFRVFIRSAWLPVESGVFARMETLGSASCRGPPPLSTPGVAAREARRARVRP